jgi:hypothetical protein
MKLGDAFTMAVPPNFDVPHLFFVISDPAKNGGSFVVVNITTNHIRAGRECVLIKGDHEWINQDSFVTFRDAREISAKMAISLNSLIGTKVQIKSPLKLDILAKIVEAAKHSKSIPIGLKKYL